MPKGGHGHVTFLKFDNQSITMSPAV